MTSSLEARDAKRRTPRGGTTATMGMGANVDGRGLLVGVCVLFFHDTAMVMKCV